MSKIPELQFAHDSNGTGYDNVETSVSCVLTRFGVRSPLSLVTLYRWYRRVVKDAETLNGLVTSVFVIENLHTCFTLSLWKDARSLREFNNRVLSHIGAANSAFTRVSFQSGGARIWSAQFRLSAISPYNLRWDGVDLEPLLKRQSRGAFAVSIEPLREK
jgi:hypothetical protein